MIISDKYSKRDANFELLRIISMIMVLVLHFLSHCNFLSVSTGNIIKDNIPWIFEGICYVAVDCFVMLTGYYMYKSKFRLNKILALIIQVLFYSVITYLIGIIIFKEQFDLREALISFTPVISGKYWFISNYIVLMLFSPFLNILIEKINKKQHFMICVISFLIFSVLSTVFNFSPALKFEKSYDIVWFIILYIVSSFIGKYGINIKKSKSIIYYVIFTLCIFGSKIFIELTGNIKPVKIITDLFVDGESKFCYTYSSVFVFLSALFLLIIFREIKIKNIKSKKLINFTGSLVLTCYLLPDERMWNFVDPHNFTENTALVIVYSILAIVCIFIACCIIEFIRSRIFDYIYKKIDFNKKCIDIQKYAVSKLNLISEKI